MSWYAYMLQFSLLYVPTMGKLASRSENKARACLMLDRHLVGRKAHFPTRQAVLLLAVMDGQTE